MESKESFLISIMLPLIPAAVSAYMFKSRWLLMFTVAGSILGQIFFSPFVTADFGPEATKRDFILAHVLHDLPATSIGTFIAGLLGYFLDPKHPPRRPTQK